MEKIKCKALIVLGIMMMLIVVAKLSCENRYTIEAESDYNIFYDDEILEMEELESELEDPVLPNAISEYLVEYYPESKISTYKWDSKDALFKVVLNTEEVLYFDIDGHIIY